MLVDVGYTTQDRLILDKSGWVELHSNYFKACLLVCKFSWLSVVKCDTFLPLSKRGQFRFRVCSVSLWQVRQHDDWTCVSLNYWLCGTHGVRCATMGHCLISYCDRVFWNTTSDLLTSRRLIILKLSSFIRYVNRLLAGSVPTWAYSCVSFILR